MNNTQSPEQIASRKAAILTGDAARVEAQKKAGKLLARERVEKLLDEGDARIRILTEGGEETIEAEEIK